MPCGASLKKSTTKMMKSAKWTLEPLRCHAREEPHQQEQPLREVQSDAEWADQTRLGGLSEGATAARWPSFPQVDGGEAKRPARIAYEATPWCLYRHRQS
ncbi:uncharacterized protein PGTG_18204 [Puccinia graminis f. sp. tritici CRL 75-36-700-3]|uniref:Uncharacterized protein n=1 Tax=Puccinia graminis f. sp. tritici (strain CRL 75-36-700-3 / race SCCL) TaxID=418459 RepID=E3L814_PUCGT|nr:uncharacterized protein PGTG_18204 [Puccinia graminis f. sp. tritici CRL 75-36-700-3]EFP92689.2 hypothetical protein PGTG_18204 [Puccinia graminis f. sp. tritici CRL 75-36-700-3]